jgi:2-polyprenyl-6-methoxyphenol hydroxylase-like FAD-dependent oxidoreductase
VYESAREVKELGVGITLLPHGMRELTALGLEERLRAVAIENEESVFFNRFGQLIYREPRGRFAGYEHPGWASIAGSSIAALRRGDREAAAGSIVTGRRCDGVEQDAAGFRFASRARRSAPISRSRATVSIPSCAGSFIPMNARRSPVSIRGVA